MTTTTPPAAQQPATERMVEPRSRAGVWWKSYRHHLRIVRKGSIAWVAGLTAISAGVAVTVEDRIGTEAERQALRAMEEVPAFEALQGRMVEVATMEGFTLARWGMFSILAAVWAMLSAARLLRGAEEAGHVEPLRAGLLTSRALLTSSLAALFTVYLVFALAIGTTHTAVGMDPATAWALGGAAALLLATFATAGALASELAATRRRAAGLVGAFLGVTLAVRIVAAATATPDWVWWATPFGWMGFLHEVDGARVWVFAGFTALLVVLLGAAVAVARRDLQAGVLVRAERTVARARPVRSQVGLATRLTAGAAATWAVIIGVLVTVLSLLTRDFIDAVAEMATMVELVGDLFGMVLDTAPGMLAATFFFVSVLLAVAAAGQAAAVRDEEATWRIEHLLVRPVGRTRWLATRVLVSAAALLIIAVAGGIVGWAATVLSGASVTVLDGILAGLNVVPVAWLTLGLGMAVLGIAPRLTAPLTYGFVVVAFLLDFVGPFLDPPQWVLDLSPFRHLAAVPAVDPNVGAALVMLGVGVAGSVVGLASFRRRDLQEA